MMCGIVLKKGTCYLPIGHTGECLNYKQMREAERLAELAKAARTVDDQVNAAWEMRERELQAHPERIPA